MTLDTAISAHADWKLKLILFVNEAGCLDTDQVRNDRQCSLGYWIYENNQKYQNFPEYQAFKDGHTEFHRLAGEIVRLVQEGKKEDAKDLLAPTGAFSVLTRQIEERIFRLRSCLRKKAA